MAYGFAIARSPVRPSERPMQRVVVITGPTASGKSAVAAAVARRTGGEIVCADAYQLYAGLPILTAQPSPEEQAAAPHHLYGSVPLDGEMDAAAYARMAEACIADIQSRGRLPILCGGGGLYIKAVTHGLAPLPPGDEALRTRLAAEPPEALIAQLLALDPAAAQTLDLRNPRYVERALEICLLTGRPASELRSNFAAGPRAEFVAHAFLPGRETLYARVNTRTLAMFAQGVLDEVRALKGRPLSATAAKTLGLGEIQSLLTGALSLPEAVKAIQQATRRYAKRQGSWFRRETWMQLHGPEWPGVEALAEEIIGALQVTGHSLLPPRTGS